MKMLTAIVLLMSAICSFASTTDSRTFVYDGSQDSMSFDLNAEKTHTEYRYEQRREICYRREVHYRTVCQNTPQGRVCQTIPHYRDVPYTCYRTVQIPYEVFDYHVQARVNLSVSSEMVNSGVAIKATLRGDELTVSSNDKNQFVILKHQKLNQSMNGSVKMIDGSYQIELVEAAPVVNALNLTDISLKDSILNFKMGPVAVRELIGLSLHVKKSPIFGSDTTLFDRELAASEVMMSAEESAASVNVDIEKLGVNLGGGRYKLTAKAFFKYTGTVINAREFEHLEHSRTLIFKN